MQSSIEQTHSPMQSSIEETQPPNTSPDDGHDSDASNCFRDFVYKLLCIPPRNDTPNDGYWSDE